MISPSISAHDFNQTYMSNFEQQLINSLTAMKHTMPRNVISNSDTQKGEHPSKETKQSTGETKQSTGETNNGEEDTITLYKDLAYNSYLRYRECLSVNGGLLEHLPHQNYRMCLIAVSQNGLNIKFVKRQTARLRRLAVVCCPSSQTGRTSTLR